MFLIQDPPYFLLVAGMLAALASGLAFEATLKELVQAWAKTRSSRMLANFQGVQLQLPFLGICIGVCVFLGSGLEIFGFPTWLSYAIAIPLTIFMGWLVWYQLGKLLVQLDKGGSRALDLDSFS
ncbi:hypothetical protein IQ264_20185 [Phormidium sp. LEGE 05292]|uniref:hypothetical protein n=1 Tax=[Phormidium] sp. LEGE 05292 TaxID=767427 RepID=UPI00187E5ADC|nr:hypothetical protein [Phormidium sp. LEGE 05292]MBE9227747.1 hypothetical protein [Phormidium sp. LEGE 05292]